MFQDIKTTIKRELEETESNGISEEDGIPSKKSRNEDIHIKEEEVEIEDNLGDNNIEKSRDKNAELNSQLNVTENNREKNKQTEKTNNRNLQNQNPLEDLFWVQDGLYFEEQDASALPINNFPTVTEKPTTSTGATTSQRNDKNKRLDGVARNQEPANEDDSTYSQELLKYLQNDTDGKGVLTIYEKNNSLTPTARRTLVHLLVQREKDEALKSAKPGEVLKDWENSQEEVRVNPKRRKGNGKELDESFEFHFDNNGVKWGKCKLCLAKDPPNERIFKMTSSNTTGVRRHLRKCHQTEFQETYPLASNSKRFLDQKLLDEKVVEWAAKKYLPLNFFDDDETRELFLHLNSTVEVPSKKKMTKLVINSFENMQTGVKKIVQSNSSKLSFTLNGWSSSLRRSFIGINCHFIDDDWELHSLLIDFVHSHKLLAGKDAAQSFYETTEDFQISEKVLGITINNTNANSQFMEELSYLLSFDFKNQHFQCFPNILNIALEEILKYLDLETNCDEENDKDEEEIEDDVDDNDDDDDDDDVEDNDEHDQTINDEVNEILSNVETNCQASPLSKLRNLFKLVKNSKKWKNKLQNSCQACGIKIVLPNNDPKTKCESTCEMINFALRMQKALILFCEKNIVLNKLIITDNDWILLQEIYKYLRFFKILVKNISGKKYPTLNSVVVGFNMLLHKIEDSISYFQKKVRNLMEDKIKSALQIGLEKLMKYYDKKNWIYCVVLILDPRHRLETFDTTSWGRKMKASSLEIFKNIFKTEYCNTPEQMVDPICVESTNQLEIKTEDDDDDIDNFSLYKRREKFFATSTRNDWEKEFNTYTAGKRAYATIDILTWWKLNEKNYPNLARMARDFLAISASSQPTELISTRSSVTVKKHQNRLTDKELRYLMGLNSWITSSLTRKIKSTIEN